MGRSRRTSIPACAASRAVHSESGRPGSTATVRGRRRSRSGSKTSRRAPRSSTITATRGDPIGAGGAGCGAAALEATRLGRGPGATDGAGGELHGRPKRLASPRRACHWSRPTTATSRTTMSPARAVQTRAGIRPLASSEGGSAPLPKPPPEQSAPAKPALEVEHPCPRGHGNLDRPLADRDLRRRARRARGLVHDLHGLEQIHRALQLGIALELVLDPRLLVDGRRRRLLAGSRLRHLHDDVRRDALAVDGPALGGEVLGRGQSQARAVGERADGLHRALAEALRAQDDRAAPVLEGAGHDLGGRGTALVDEDNDGKVAPGALAAGLEAHVLVADAAFRVDDELARIEELLGHLDRGSQEPPGVIAEIEDEALDLLALVVLLQSPLDILARLLLELAEADVLDAGLELAALDGLHLDQLARDRVVLGLGQALADDADDDLAPRLAAHSLDGIGELHVLGRHALDLDDAVPRQDARAEGRRALDGRYHGQDVILEGDLDAQAAELPRRLHSHFAVHVGVQERGMRIEATQGALDRAVDEVFGRHLVDVLALDDREHLGEEAEILIGGGLIIALAGHPAPQGQGEQEQEGRDHQRLLHVTQGAHRGLLSPASSNRATLSRAVSAIERGPGVAPGSAPRNRGAAPAASPCPRPSRSPVPA